VSLRINGTRVEIGDPLRIVFGHHRNTPCTFYGRQSGKHNTFLVRVELAKQQFKIMAVKLDQLALPKRESSMLEAIEAVESRATAGKGLSDPESQP